MSPTRRDKRARSVANDRVVSHTMRGGRVLGAKLSYALRGGDAMLGLREPAVC